MANRASRALTSRALSGDLERISDLSNGAEAYEDTCAKKPDLFPTLTSHSKMPKHSNQNRRNETRDRPFDNTPPAKFTH